MNGRMLRMIFVFSTIFFFYLHGILPNVAMARPGQRKFMNHWTRSIDGNYYEASMTTTRSTSQSPEASHPTARSPSESPEASHPLDNGESSMGKFNEDAWWVEHATSYPPPFLSPTIAVDGTVAARIDSQQRLEPSQAKHP